MRKPALSATIVLAAAAVFLFSGTVQAQQLLLSRPATGAVDTQPSVGRLLTPREARWADHENEELWTMTQVLKLTPEQHAAIRKIWEADHALPSPAQVVSQCSTRDYVANWPLIGKSQCINSVMTSEQKKKFRVYVRVDNMVEERMDSLTKYLGLTSQQRWKLRPLEVKNREMVYWWRWSFNGAPLRFNAEMFWSQPTTNCSMTVAPSGCVGDILNIAEHDGVRTVLTPLQKSVFNNAIVATREKKREDLNNVYFIPGP